MLMMRWAGALFFAPQGMLTGCLLALAIRCCARFTGPMHVMQASGVVVDGNTIFKSFGAGIMVFGHETTSHNLSISNNMFITAGCVQTRGDRAAIAFMCPNGHKASGRLENNLFETCSGKGDVNEAYNQAFPGCTDDWNKTGNLIDSTDPSARVVAEPRLTVPPSPSSEAVIPVSAQSATPNATLRYTTDGSRPTEESPVMPAGGVPLPWPGPVVAINFRGFRKGFRPSITNGVVLELNYMWPDPGAPPPPPAPASCPGLPGVMCDDCPPATIPLTCPPGHRVEYVAAPGDDGSCDCDEFCASDWDKAIKTARPQWTGATSVFPSGVASTCCICVQATHWCPLSGGSGGCGESCATVGKPSPVNYCVPDGVGAGQ